MRKLVQLASRGSEAVRSGLAAVRYRRLLSTRIGPGAVSTEPAAPAPKPPAPLPLCFLLSHLEEDGIVRLDGVKLGVCEVMGLEIDEPKLGAFAGALNALDFPAQLLVRQHAPRLDGLRDRLQEAQPDEPAPADEGSLRFYPKGCWPTWRQGTASWTGASTRSASPRGRTTCAACWRGQGCQSTRSPAAPFGSSSCRPP